MTTNATTQESGRKYRVSVLGGGSRSFKSITAAIDFALEQVQQSWSDNTWVVWNRRKDRFACMVGRDGSIEWSEKDQ